MLTFILLGIPFELLSLPDRRPLKIIPAQNCWKGASQRDVEKLLYATAETLWEHAHDTRLNPIIVHNAEGGPIVYFKRGRNNEYRVKLSTGGTYWAQYAFQFSHEFCHILCHYKEGDTSNLWFEETICETASLFTLRAMAESWKKKPPYANWKSYNKALFNYAQERLDDHPLPDDVNDLATWYASEADYLIEHPTDRKKNTLVAAQLLPLFEEDPTRWATVSFINEGRSNEPQSFNRYLKNWRKHCPPAHREFIDELAALFGEEL